MAWEKVLAAIMLCTLSVAASAAEPLWQNVEAGMTLDQVRDLYPSGKDEIGRKVEHHARKTELHGFLQIGRCKPRVEILHPAGVVTGVYIWMQARGSLVPMCASEARAAVLTKFGEPITSHNRVPSAGELWRGDHETMTWVRDGVTITFEHSDRNDAWHIEYDATGENAAAGL